MSYSRSTTIDSGPTGDTVVQAVLDLDTDLTAAFTHLNTHEALTTSSHGLTSGEGDIVGTDALQTLTRKTITSPTITGTVTGSGMTLSGGTISGGTISGGTISGGTITGAITASGATIASPTITGGTATNQTITTPTITGGTSTNLVMTTPNIGVASGTNLTLSGLSASLPLFTSASNTLTSKSVANTLTALGLPSDPIKGDGTANRTMRTTIYTISDATTTGIDVQATSIWNGETIAKRTELAKGGTSGGYNLSAGGNCLGVESSYTPVAVITASLYYNTTGTAMNIFGRVENVTPQVFLYFYNATTGAVIDLTAEVDSAQQVTAFITYLTTA